MRPVATAYARLFAANPVERLVAAIGVSPGDVNRCMAKRRRSIHLADSAQLSTCRRTSSNCRICGQGQRQTKSGAGRCPFWNNINFQGLRRGDGGERGIL